MIYFINRDRLSLVYSRVSPAQLIRLEEFNPVCLIDSSVKFLSYICELHLAQLLLNVTDGSTCIPLRTISCSFYKYFAKFHRLFVVNSTSLKILVDYGNSIARGNFVEAFRMTLNHGENYI